MIRHTLLTLALLAAPAAIAVAQQPSPLQGQAADTAKSATKSKMRAAHATTHAKKATAKRHAKPAPKAAAKDTTLSKP